MLVRISDFGIIWAIKISLTSVLTCFPWKCKRHIDLNFCQSFFFTDLPICILIFNCPIVLFVTFFFNKSLITIRKNEVYHTRSMIKSKFYRHDIWTGYRKRILHEWIIYAHRNMHFIHIRMNVSSLTSEQKFWRV